MIVILQCRIFEPAKAYSYLSLWRVIHLKFVTLEYFMISPSLPLPSTHHTGVVLCCGSSRRCLHAGSWDGRGSLQIQRRCFGGVQEVQSAQPWRSTHGVQGTPYLQEPTQRIWTQVCHVHTNIELGRDINFHSIFWWQNLKLVMVFFSCSKLFRRYRLQWSLWILLRLFVANHPIIQLDTQAELYNEH